MGLDQYAYELGNKVGEDHPDYDKFGGYDYRSELAYWRKHNRLHGWMEDLYNAKRNEGEFNCVDVELDEDDLSSLEKAIATKDLPETGGFFFGGDSYGWYHEKNEEGVSQFDEDLAFIEDARKALSRGRKVIYTSWW